MRAAMIQDTVPVPPSLVTVAERVEQRLDALLAAESARWGALSDDLVCPLDSLRSLVMGGGKRLRPAFCFWGYRAAGGGAVPASPAVPTAVGSPPPGGTPDPWALYELTRYVRPPDYAATFARQATTRSGLDTAIAVVGVNRPPWLEGVIAEPGVVECSLDDALALFAP